MKKYEVLKKYFGYSGFRQGQEELIDSILSGKDTVGIMPTGAGKSICYQVPAVLMEGITLVVSPLISLMKDQVGALNQAGIRAAYLNSSLSFGQYRKALALAKEGEYKIIYVAPERLETEGFLDFVAHVNISMICIDEAHCISQWGQDFRPSYLKILNFIECLSKKPVISAFTATATVAVREDIAKILQLQDYTLLVTGFDRKNLYFAVRKPKDKFAFLEKYVEENDEKSGIIYCSTRKAVEEVCYKLQRIGLPITRYHAGLSDEERRQNQDDFIFDRKPIIVATNAFGMGIDKSNVRYVIHYNMPKDVESYYQEAGRAGRDGETAECILLYSGQDVVINQFMIDNNRDNSELDWETVEKIKERDRDRLKKMTYYCTTTQCLREYMLNYFGDRLDKECGNCGSCLMETELVDVTAAASAIIEFIKQCGRSYGMNTIAQVLHGSKVEVVRRYGLDQHSCYGVLASISIGQIRLVMEHLIHQGVLVLTNGEYAVLRIAEAGEFIQPVIMKMPKEEKQEPKAMKRQNKVATGDEDYDIALFDRLRELRLEISREIGAPPYIIFADKALKDMARRMPSSREEMLEVSGVGEVKYQKYGERFIEAIQKFK